MISIGIQETKTVNWLDMVLVLQKSQQAKTRVDLKEKRVGSINGIVSLIGI